jgi:exonuclease SbcD
MDFPGLNTAVFGVGFKTHRESRNLLKGFRVSDGALVNILLAHGELMTAIGAEGPVYAPIDEADLRLCGADYCALGHYHRARDVFSDGRGLRAAYPGSPEPLCYGESGDFGVLMLEIEAGGSISVARIVTQRRRYHDIEVDAGDCADAAELDHAVRHALSGLDFHGDFIELTLRGSLPPGLEFKPADFSDLLETAFDYRISDQTRPAYDLDAIAGENNARGAFCRNVMNRAADAGVEAGERELLDEALKLGLAAFDGREVGEIPL